MNERILPKNFFRDNPFENFSAAQIAHFKMSVSFEAEIDKIMEETVSRGIAVERCASIAEEKGKIEGFSTAEEVVAFMRTSFDGVNQTQLCRKALTMQETVIPLMLQRYRTTLQDVFVDTSVMILAHAEMCYVERLIEMYDQIRNPYAKSMACLVIGMRKTEGAASLLLKEYERMKREYPEENLCQGPLLGLYAMYDKI